MLILSVEDAPGLSAHLREMRRGRREEKKINEDGKLWDCLSVHLRHLDLLNHEEMFMLHVVDAPSLSAYLLHLGLKNHDEMCISNLVEMRLASAHTRNGEERMSNVVERCERKLEGE